MNPVTTVTPCQNCGCAGGTFPYRVATCCDDAVEDFYVRMPDTGMGPGNQWAIRSGNQCFRLMDELQSVAGLTELPVDEVFPYQQFPNFPWHSCLRCYFGLPNVFYFPTPASRPAAIQLAIQGSTPCPCLDISLPFYGIGSRSVSGSPNGIWTLPWDEEEQQFLLRLTPGPLSGIEHSLPGCGGTATIKPLDVTFRVSSDINPSVSISGLWVGTGVPTPGGPSFSAYTEFRPPQFPVPGCYYLKGQPIAAAVQCYEGSSAWWTGGTAAITW